jgi:small-conductance mechanosensitive channel
MRKINRVSILALVLSILVLTACNVLVTTETPAPKTETPTPTSAQVTPEAESTGILEEIVITRTPLPTALPGPIQQEVERFVARAGLARTQILGLNITDWVGLLLSVFYIILGYLVGTFLVRSLFQRISSRISEGFDQELVKKIGADLRWIVVVLVTFYSTKSLTFISAEINTLLIDIYFVLGVFLAFRVSSYLIQITEDWYKRLAVQQNRGEELAPVITLLVRSARVIIALIFITIFLSHFGINVTAFAAAIGIGGLAISLAAQNTIRDAIAGFIILIDRPFRIGDRIEIQEVGTWGDVTDIGLRTTRIRTRDNRLVIVPNSIIGDNQVINYSYPDPQYRIETHVGVAYGTDIEKARSLMVETVRNLDVVLKDKPVDALYIDMGDSAMIFRVRWWIESYVDTRRVIDCVHTALQYALDEAGIDSPFPTQSINMVIDPESSERFSQALSRPGAIQSEEINRDS